MTTNQGYEPCPRCGSTNTYVQINYNPGVELFYSTMYGQANNIETGIIEITATCMCIECGYQMCASVQGISNPDKIYIEALESLKTKWNTRVDDTNG